MARSLLVLGGSWFLGRAVVQAGLDMGWTVTTFRRGLSGEDVPGAGTIRGDRAAAADVARLADAGPWDLVVDTSAYVPAEAGVIARALEPASARFVVVSSVSAYAGWPTEPLDESCEALECPPDAGPDYGYEGDPGPSVYGFTKAGVERAVSAVFGAGRTTVLRPGVILGPGEYVGRLPWWLNRVRRGGRVLAPGQPSRPIQPVDVRDVASFAVNGPPGVFNLTGPRTPMADFLTSCINVVGSTAELTWVTDEQWLIEQKIRQWTELPLWRTYRGTWQVSSAAALKAGFAPRSLRSTVADTWSWMRQGGSGVAHERSAELGIDPGLEAALLGMWDARERDHCG